MVSHVVAVTDQLLPARLAVQNIIDEVYPVNLAHLEYSLFASVSGLVIKVSGLSDKLSNLMEVLVQCLVTFKHDTNKEMFQAVLEE